MVSRAKPAIIALKRLKKARTLAVQRDLLKNCDRQLIVAIVEIISNILQNRIPLKPTQRKRLQQNAKRLQQLAKIRSETTARKYIVQNGGSLIPLLVGPILSAISAFL